MEIIYLHGFNSDGEGWKSQALRKHFPNANVQAPDLPAHPQEAQQIIECCLRNSTQSPLLVGSSLGGFYAYYNSAIHQLPALLFNPSLQPYLTLNDRGIGTFKTWTKGRDYHFKYDYLDLLQQMKVTAEKTCEQKLLHFFLATDDDILDHQYLPEEFPDAQLQWFPRAGHRFSKFEKVLKLIKKDF